MSSARKPRNIKPNHPLSTPPNDKIFDSEILAIGAFRAQLETDLKNFNRNKKDDEVDPFNYVSIIAMLDNLARTLRRISEKNISDEAKNKEAEVEIEAIRKKFITMAAVLKSDDQYFLQRAVLYQKAYSLLRKAEQHIAPNKKIPPLVFTNEFEPFPTLFIVIRADKDFYTPYKSQESNGRPARIIEPIKGPIHDNAPPKEDADYLRSIATTILKPELSQEELKNVASTVSNLSKLTLERINLLDPEKPPVVITNMFALELARMIERKEEELRNDKQSRFYKAKMFVADLVDYNETGEQKLAVMKKMFNIVVGQSKEAPSFSDAELEALNGSRLGKLIDRYRGTKALPQEFYKADANYKKKPREFSDTVNRPRA